VQCGKYRISGRDSEGFHPQPGHGAVMESVSRDKSANATLPQVGSEAAERCHNGITQPPPRATAP
jgi:hypothetical protein